MIRNALFGLAAASLAAAPVAAQAGPVEPSRGSAPVEADSQLRGQGSLFFFLGIAAVILGIFFLVDDDDEAASA